MTGFKGVSAVLAAVSLIASTQAAAAGCGTGASLEANKLRNLDVMLMVTGLRCRTGPDNFQPDYYRFVGNHLAQLNAASRLIRADLARTYGANGAARALDKLSVTMANEYGNGNGTMSCASLKKATSALATERTQAGLIAAADRLLPTVIGPSGRCDAPLTTLASAGR